MGIKERKERDREQQQELILSAAAEIMAKDGIDKLSIRKLADKIEYSPSIVYHYFKDKDDIIGHLMRRGYQKIIEALSNAQVSSANPVERLKQLTRNYINAALQMPQEYISAQLSNSPSVIEYTSSMFKGASIRKPALAILTQCLKEIYMDDAVNENEVELTAQIIAASTFGLIIKLIIEKIDEEQRNKLVEHYIEDIIEGMVLGRSINNK